MPTTPHRDSDDLGLPDETLKVRAQVRRFAKRAAASQLNNTPESLDGFQRNLVARMADACLYMTNSDHG
jgi:hypothetical protein